MPILLQKASMVTQLPWGSPLYSSRFKRGVRCCFNIAVPPGHVHVPAWSMTWESSTRVDAQVDWSTLMWGFTCRTTWSTAQKTEGKNGELSKAGALSLTSKTKYGHEHEQHHDLIRAHASSRSVDGISIATAESVLGRGRRREHLLCSRCCSLQDQRGLG